MPKKDTQKHFGKIININSREKEQERKEEKLTIEGEKLSPYLTLSIVPVPKPRMTQRDKWMKRPATDRYKNFKMELYLLCYSCRWKPTDDLEVKFVLPMPKSWSEKKKKEMDGQPHKQTPDLDNLIKAFQDALLKDDSHIHTYNNMKKIWGREGQIILKR